MLGTIIEYYRKQAVGGKESALFASLLSGMYNKLARTMGWSIFPKKMVKESLGKGIKHAVYQISGQNAYGLLKYENGVHKVQRVPETEKRGRIHSSTAVVIVMPVVPFEFHLDEKDLIFQTFRSSGAGGQHVNKTESAVRVIHVPTGMRVANQEERYQEENKKRAIELLRERLYMMKYSDYRM